MTDRHLQLLAWLRDHEGEPLTSAVDALGLSLVEVEQLTLELVDADMIERTALY